MERPALVDEYISINAEIKRLEKLKETMKQDVSSILEECGGWDDIYTEQATYTKYDDDLIYSWVAKHYGDGIVESISKKTLDWDKFHSLVKLGKIDLEKLPEECIHFSTITKVITGRKRKNDLESATGV